MHNTKIDIIQEGLCIPAQLIEWYTNTKGKGKETDMVIKEAVDRMKLIQGIRSGDMKDMYTGIKMKEATLIRLEEILGNEVWEAVIMPELVSTRRAWDVKKITQIIQGKALPGMIILNLTHSEGLIEQSDRDEVQKLIDIAKGKNIPIIIFTNEEAGEIGDSSSWHMETACAKQLVGWESPYEHIMVPILEMGENINSHMSVWGKKEDSRVMDIIYNKTCGNINNMYEITADIEDYWECPVCKKEGIKVNEHYGYCLADKCVGICMPKSIQDVSRNKIRKVENLVMDCRPKKGKSKK